MCGFIRELACDLVLYPQYLLEHATALTILMLTCGFTIPFRPQRELQCRCNRHHNLLPLHWLN